MTSEMTAAEAADVRRLENGWTFLEEHEDVLEDQRMRDGWIRQLRAYEQTWQRTHAEEYARGCEAIRAHRAQLHRLDV